MTGPRPPSGTEALRPGDRGYLTTGERRRAAEAERQAAQREERLAAGGVEAAMVRIGLVRGKHYTEWVEEIRALKRSGKFDEALALLRDCIAAAERDRQGREPAPWYTEQAAIVCRKLGDLDHEVAVLER